jgi:site-specific DNA recombinase
MSMVIDGYIRVSRLGGRSGDSFISVDQQRDAIEAYAKANGLMVGEWFEDLDESGATLDRPGLQKALARARERESGGFVAAKLDRISRSIGALAQLIEEARDGGWTLVAIDVGLDVRTAGGRLVADILGAVASWELERRRQDWDDAQGRAVARGVHVASRTPTGYVRGRDGRLEPHPIAGPAVTDLFERRAAGDGWTALAAFLNERHVVGPYGNRRWTASAVSKLIRNRVYLGEARSGKHVNADAHPPLVTREQFEAAQAMAGRPGRSARNGDGMLLSGLVRCGGCRYLVKPDRMRGRNGEKLGLYRCRASHAAGRCETPTSILARVIEPYIEAQFLAALAPGGPLAEASAVSADTDAAFAAVDDAEAELVAYRDTPGIVTAIGHDRFLEGLESRAKAVEEARVQARNAAGAPTLAAAGDLTPGALVDAWPSLTVAERRTLLSAAIDAVVLRPVRGRGEAVAVADRVVILWRGDAPADLPRRGLRVPLAPFPFPEAPAHVRMAAA